MTPRLALPALIFVASSVALAAETKIPPRVHIIESRSWAVSGWNPFIGVLGGVGRGGDRPQTAEILKTFAKRCPKAALTLQREQADYIVLLEHEGGKQFFRKDNKFAVFDREGNLLRSGSTRSLGNAVGDACGVIEPVKSVK